MGDGGPAAAAALSSPINVWVDSNGNLLIADFSYGIRQVAAETGIITTLVHDTSSNFGQGITARFFGQ